MVFYSNLFFFSNYSPTLLIAFCTIWFVPTISANKNGCDCAGVTHLIAGTAAVIDQMCDDGRTGVIHTRISRKVDGDICHRKRLCDLHDGSKHELWTHGRNRDVPQFLPAGFVPSIAPAS